MRFVAHREARLHKDNPLRILYAGPEEMVPVYATESAAGADLKAHMTENITLEPGERVLIPTGIHLAIPKGWEGQVRPRSGLALKKGLTVLNSPGTIDADYRGEVRVILINLGREPAELAPGERIAQLIIAPVVKGKFEYRNELPGTSRGGGGFGSTGK